MSARWSKQPSEKGLAAVCQSPRGFCLNKKGETIITVRPKSAGPGADRYTIMGWYWVGIGHNTLWRPDGGMFATADEAKADAMCAYKSHLGSSMNNGGNE